MSCDVKTNICKINVVSRLQDNQDGGYTINVYNDTEEMLKNHPMAKDGELTEDQKRTILNAEDPYENGYLDKDVIEVEIKGQVPLWPLRLAKPIHFYAGH